MRCRKKYLSNALRALVVLICLSGFLYQTMVFMFFYWTYPTVVDIQVTSPTHIDMPAFTFCNHIGYILDNFCEHSLESCPAISLVRLTGICTQLPLVCDENGDLPEDVKIITYTKYAQLVQFTPEINEKFAMKLKDYMNCTIEFAGETRKCNMESIMGSMYSTEDLPHYCFTLYSKWGQPNKKQEKIEKGATMKLDFYLNATQRPRGSKGGLRFNPPSTAAVQIAVHSPYYLPSPFLAGSGFIGGKSYEIQLKQEEKHLLPAPYQTNCTDYMTAWNARGGKAPVNQLTVLQECKMNHTYATHGCIPLSIDYPHNYNVCKACGKTNVCKERNVTRDNCTSLAENYNQPCDFISYEVEINEKIITIHKILKSSFTLNEENIGAHSEDNAISLFSDGINEKKTSHDCSDRKMVNVECSTVKVEVVFERFEITNLTYNPKYESMETFSVIGGYLGMWLGVSLVAVYDFISTGFILLKNSCTNRMRHKRRRQQLRKKQSLKISNEVAYSERKNRKLHPSLYDGKYFKEPSNYSNTHHY